MKISNYAAIFKDGSYIEKNSLSELKQYDNIQFCIKIQLHERHTTNFKNNYEYYKYNIIDNNGNPINLSYDNFDLVDISPETRRWGAESVMNLKLYDKKLCTIRNVEIETICGELNVFKDKIFPLLQNINEHISWKSYLTELENTKLRAENEKLKNEIEELKSKLSS